MEDVYKILSFFGCGLFLHKRILILKRQFEQQNNKYRRLAVGVGVKELKPFCDCLLPES